MLQKNKFRNRGTDDQGQKLSLSVRSKASITVKDGTALKLSDIKKDSKVTIEYTVNRAGKNRAQSIKLVE